MGTKTAILLGLLLLGGCRVSVTQGDINQSTKICEGNKGLAHFIISSNREGITVFCNDGKRQITERYFEESL